MHHTITLYSISFVFHYHFSFAWNIRFCCVLCFLPFQNAELLYAEITPPAYSVLLVGETINDLTSSASYQFGGASPSPSGVHFD